MERNEDGDETNAAKPARYFARQRGPYYFEVRDRLTGCYVDIKVGRGAREAAKRETDCRNAADNAA